MVPAKEVYDFNGTCHYCGVGIMGPQHDNFLGIQSVTQAKNWQIILVWSIVVKFIYDVPKNQNSFLNNHNFKKFFNYLATFNSWGKYLVSCDVQLYPCSKFARTAIELSSAKST